MKTRAPTSNFWLPPRAAAGHTPGVLNASFTRDGVPILAATGMEVFKAPAIRARLPQARLFWRAGAALRHAARGGGALAVWAAALPPALPARAAALGVPLVQVEDGFIRSAGLGVQLAPACSWVLDAAGAHFDPSRPSELERILAREDFPPALLARAGRLRRALLAGGVTKYNLRGGTPGFLVPPGRRAVLVCGQVEGDASLRRGGGAVRSNQALLQAARARAPDAFLIWKPHPDVEAGMRPGAVRHAGLADAVAAGVPIAALFPLVQEVHVMSSLAGFEALLRGLRVVCHGQPFYAGWGLTEDLAPPPRRGRPLALDALLAGALIRYPAYWDPVTGAPCEVEDLLARLDGLAPPPPPRVPAWLRRAVARASGAVTAWGARL